MRHLKCNYAENPFECDEKSIKSDSSEKSFLSEELLNHSNHEVIEYDICGKENISNNAFQQHFKPHVKSDEDCVICEQCGQSCGTEELLTLHMRSCKTCKKVFCNKDILLRHLREQNWQIPTQCEECEESFYSNKHAQENISLECPFCLDIFTTQYSFDAHVKVHKRIDHGYTLNSHLKLFTCEVCHNTFTINFDLSSNKTILPESDFKSHKESRQVLECAICTKQFLTELALMMHLESHNVEENFYSERNVNKAKCFRCEQCEGMYISNELLVLHEMVCGTCKYCKTQFNSKVFLLRHLLVHYEEGPAECMEWDKHFKSIVYSDKHLQSIHSNTSFICSACKLMFNRYDSKNNLSSQKKDDYEERLEMPPTKDEHEELIETVAKVEEVEVNEEYRCGNCNGIYQSWVEFEEHNSFCAMISSKKGAHQELIESVAKVNEEYKCGSCEETFQTSIELEEHKSICKQAEEKLSKLHLQKQNRNYPCGECDSSYKNEEGLSYHVRVKHGMLPKIRCKLCDVSMSRKNFEIHLKRHKRKLHYMNSKLHRPYKCEQCGNQYMDKKTLVRHQNRNECSVYNTYERKEYLFPFADHEEESLDMLPKKDECRRDRR